MAEERNIELRSEKVKNIVGKIPPAVERNGITIIGLVLMVMLVVSMLIPYKETVCFGVMFDTIHSKTEGVAYVEARRASLLKEGMPVSIAVAGERIKGIIASVSDNRINGKHEVFIRTTENDEIVYEDELNVNVVVTEKSWFKAIFGNR